MVKRYEIYGPAQCEDESVKGEWVKHEDFEKLLKLTEQMLDDLIGEGMHTLKYENEMKLIRGEFTMADLHASIMEPIIERCKKALEATND